MEEKVVNIYNNQNEVTEHIFDKSISHEENLYNRAVDSKASEIKNREDASKAEIDRYSNEKGKEQNQIYETYMLGSVKDAFNRKTQLVEERLALLEEIANKKIEIKQMQLDAELDIKKKYNEAEIAQEKMLAKWQLKIDNAKKEYKESNKNKFTSIFNKIFFPILGIALGVLTFALMYMLK